MVGKRVIAKKSLAFRLDPAAYSELAQIARDENASVGQVARHFVLGALRNGASAPVPSGLPEVFAELDSIQQEIAALRESLMTVFETVLLNTTSAEREEVARWLAELRGSTT